MDGASCSHDVSAVAGGTMSSSNGNPAGGFDQQDEEDAAEEDDPSSSSSSSSLLLLPSPPQQTMTNERNAVISLDNFRQLWRRELQGTSQTGCDRIVRNRNSADSNNDDEDNARDLYLQGVEAECNGQLYDAIRYYRRAVQLVPDIEFRVADLIPKANELNVDDSNSSGEDDDDSIETVGENDHRVVVKYHDDLIKRFFRLLSRDGKMCRPFYEHKGSHVSILPSEIILYIFKWVISTELDMRSLEQLSLVCRGFYLCARDTELWRLACLKVWGANCGSPNKYGSWRDMFISRPRLRFCGAYISKTTYVRPGEPAFQDQTYRSWHVVNYYRYLRFFPEGLVLMLTTPEEPVCSLPKLRVRNARCTALLSGHYRIHGNVVSAILKRTKGSESVVPQSTNRYRRVRQIYHDPGEQTFHLEFEVTAYKARTNYKLEWRHYSTHTVYRNGQESVCEFDLSLAKFPPLWFSRVKSYTAFSERPLGVH